MCVFGLCQSLPDASPSALYEKPQLLQAVGQGVAGGAGTRAGMGTHCPGAILSPLRVWCRTRGTLCLRDSQMLNSNAAIDCSGVAMVQGYFSFPSTLLSILFLPQPELGTLMHLLVPTQRS